MENISFSSCQKAFANPKMKAKLKEHNIESNGKNMKYILSIMIIFLMLTACGKKEEVIGEKYGAPAKELTQDESNNTIEPEVEDQSENIPQNDEDLTDNTEDTPTEERGDGNTQELGEAEEQGEEDNELDDAQKDLIDQTQLLQELFQDILGE